ncbi:MAG: hypothetical protein PHI97_03905 [Desulfobulbus sp.]|nr:hypothetical protein [Desulfobulbus sp.]
MKMRCLLGVSMGVLMSGSLAWSADFPWEMKLPFKEATIHYQLSGSQQGEETLYLKDYGRLRAKYHHGSITMMGMTTKTETVEISDSDWIATYDLVEKSGSKTTNPNKLYQNEYSKLSRSEKKNFEKNAKEFGAGMMAQFGSTVTRSSDKFLGYDCDVIAVSGMSTNTVLRGSDVSLKTETSMMGIKSANSATLIDTTSAIPDSVFLPPAGINAQLNPQAESMMEGMVQQTVNAFKDPEGAKKMQSQAGAASMMVPTRQQAMEADGVSAEDQQEMMRQMQEAMQQLQKVQQK